MEPLQSHKMFRDDLSVFQMGSYRATTQTKTARVIRPKFHSNRLFFGWGIIEREELPCGFSLPGRRQSTRQVTLRALRAGVLLIVKIKNYSTILCKCLTVTEIAGLSAVLLCPNISALFGNGVIFAVRLVVLTWKQFLFKTNKQYKFYILWNKERKHRWACCKAVTVLV